MKGSAKDTECQLKFTVRGLVESTSYSYLMCTFLGHTIRDVRNTLKRKEYRQGNELKALGDNPVITDETHDQCCVCDNPVITDETHDQCCVWCLGVALCGDMN